MTREKLEELHDHHCDQRSELDGEIRRCLSLLALEMDKMIVDPVTDTLTDFEITRLVERYNEHSRHCNYYGLRLKALDSTWMPRHRTVEMEVNP